MKWFKITCRELSRLRLWLGIAVLLMLGSFAFFMLASMVFLEEVMQSFSLFFESLEEMAEQVFIEDIHPLEGVVYLFFNNLVASLVTMLLGPVLFFTLLSLLLNGGIIGVLGALYVVEDLGILLFLVGVLPHGILELPALIISAALGIRMGIHLIVPPGGYSRWMALKKNYLSAFQLLPLVILLLAAAAFIEVLVTPSLLELYYPGGMDPDW